MKLIKMLLLAIFCCPESLCDGAVEIRPQIYKVTAYCPCEQCCGTGSPGITASGHKIQPGDVFVAMDKSVPFGTEVSIPGYNNGNSVKVLDRGGAIKGKKIDIYLSTHQAALNWGVQYLKVYVKAGE